eukprot:gnl/Trimastix_PCT/1136.p1 GENE.gnl/Trimastix_PCT/1136~~gnl/Trimastix_PCT/1136.p1  ORF type:complete len:238 (+),score=66.42 gnl/Trimastix_PCT/1136:33-716(+)
MEDTSLPTTLAGETTGTPVPGLDIQTMMEPTFEKLLKANTETRWNVLKVDHDVEISQGGSLCRGVGTINASVPQIVAALRCHESFKKTDRTMIDLQNLYTTYIDGVHVSIDYLAYRAPSPVTNRDFVTIAFMRFMEDGSFQRAAVSVEHPGAPSRGLVRGEVVLEGFLVRPTEQAGVAHVTTVLQTNLKGWIPGAISKKIAKSQTLKVAYLRHLLTGNTRNPAPAQG